MSEIVRQRCPYCGEPIDLLIDDSFPVQCYIEDCPVCCRPMTVMVSEGSDGGPAVQLQRDDEA